MDYWHKAWICPFFIWDDSKSVGCEGGKLRWPTKDSAVRYMDRYCASHAWKQCSIALSLLDHYERKDDDSNGERK